jgi:hypothetical protein
MTSDNAVLPKLHGGLGITSIAADDNRGEHQAPLLGVVAGQQSSVPRENRMGRNRWQCRSSQTPLPGN